MPRKKATNAQPTAHDSTSIPISSAKPPKTKTHRNRLPQTRSLSFIERNLHPIPFVPTKTLDFSKHETLFKTLGLWNFINLDLDRAIRSDLLVLLIANYDPCNGCSLVNNARIKINRSSMARALGISTKKRKIEPLDFSDEFLCVIDQFMSEYVLLGKVDRTTVPDEVSSSIRHVEAGRPQNVDWAGLIWCMVKKDLWQVTETGVCYYASHLQVLMKSQVPELFRCRDPELVEEEDFQECNEQEGIRFSDPNISSGEHFLGHCNSNRVESLEERYYCPLSNSRKQESVNANVFHGFSSNLPSDDLLTSTSMRFNSDKSEQEIGDLNGIDMCLDQVHRWMDKVRTMYMEKEVACMQEKENCRSLCEMLRQRDDYCHQLMTTCVELKKSKAMDVYVLERELCIMTQLVDGYKRALKETRTAFAEYRERFQLPCEPLYKDVGGSGGLVLSVMEFDKLHLRKEQEERKLGSEIEEKMEAFQQLCLDGFEYCLSHFDLLNNRLLVVAEEAKMLKEMRKK